MKARVIATGEILEVQAISDYLNEYGQLVVEYKDNDGIIYTSFELDFGLEENIRIPDYWTRLEHQYAGMAMQGMLSNTTLITVLFDATKDHDELLKEVIICSHEYAHALVEKMKEERR